MERYRAASWLPNGHLQTIYAALFAPRPRVALRRTRWQTPDHDFIDLDWLTMSDANTPLVVLFHGLEGSSRSHYARSPDGTESSYISVAVAENQIASPEPTIPVMRRRSTGS